MKTTTSFPTTVPEPASGPQPVGGPAAGIHAAAAPDGGLPGVTRAAAGSGGVFAAFLMACLCVSCTTVSGNRNEGTFTYNSFLGNAKIGELGPEGMRNAEIDNSTGGAVIERSVDKAGKWWAWGKFWDFGGDVVNGLKDVASDNNATDEAITKSNNATKEAVETFVPPEPEVPAP